MGDKKFVVWQSLIEQLSLTAPQQLLNNLTEVTTFEKKVELLYNTPYIRSALKDWLSTCTSRPLGHKNADFSSKYRESGNAYCKKRDHTNAVKFFNKALFYAPKNSAEMRAAYGNRSHSFIQLKLFEEAIVDIERALDGSMAPRNVTLLLRKCQAYIGLGKYEEGQAVIDALMKSTGDLSSAAQKRIAESADSIYRLERFKQAYNLDGRPPNVGPSYAKEPNLKFDENPNFSCASKSLTLQQSKEKGRYVVANENINVGDVLFSETPFAFVILPHMIDKYCSFCCKRLLNLVPCDHCALASFCNEECRDKAYKSFHSWECGGLEVCYSIGITHLSLRVALMGRLEENKKRYVEVKNLVSHLNDLELNDLFNYSLSAALLAIYLEEYTNIFSQEKSKDNIFEFGGLLLLHIGQLVCNGHAITDLETVLSKSANTLLIEDQVRVATAIYPSASMMNHSCRPNIINSFFNTNLIVRATQNLKKGDEVYNCYGPMVHNTDYNQRQHLLMNQYFFICTCPYCEEKTDPISEKYLCKSCAYPINLAKKCCDKCNTPFDSKEILEDIHRSDAAYKEGNAKFEEGKYETSLELFLKSLKLREMHCHDNHRKLLECRDIIAKCLAMQGREDEAFFYLEKNVKVIEKIYGKISVELGQEIMKLLSVATSLRKNKELSDDQRIIMEKSKEYGKKGLYIFQLSYGEWHPRFHDMLQHFDFLQTSYDQLELMEYSNSLGRTY